MNIFEPPLHLHCKCEILPMKAVIAGNGTKDGKDGADWWIKYTGRLHDYCISGEDLEALGWIWGKAPKKFAPGEMAIMGIYRNDDKHLSDISGYKSYA